MIKFGKGMPKQYQGRVNLKFSKRSLSRFVSNKLTWPTQSISRQIYQKDKTKFQTKQYEGIRGEILNNRTRVSNKRTERAATSPSEQIVSPILLILSNLSFSCTKKKKKKKPSKIEQIVQTTNNNMPVQNLRDSRLDVLCTDKTTDAEAAAPKNQFDLLLIFGVIGKLNGNT